MLFKKFCFAAKVLFHCVLKLNPFKTRFFVYKPAAVVVNKKADVRIKNVFHFNCEWNDRRIAKNKTVGALFLDENAKVDIGSVTCYPGCRISVEKNAHLSIKSGYLNYNTVISCFNSIEIGENCAISENVQIRDSNNHKIIRDGYQISSPVKIGDNVWIGMGAIILSGVTVGNGSVIAAGSVVTSSIPDNCLAAGVPAKVIRENVKWER